MKSRARGKTGKSLLALSVGLGLLFSATRSVIAAGTGQQLLRGHVPAAVARLAPTGRLPGTNRLNLAIGLPLRNPAALDEFLRQLYDPRSTNFHKFLTPQEFTARFGPTEPDYQAVIRFAESNGLTLSGTHPNRLVVDVEGSVSNIERAFRIILWTYRHPTEPREFFAPDTEPSAPANLPIIDVGGLCDYGRPRPLSRPVKLSKTRPLSFNGSGPNGEYAGKDFRNAYAPGTALTGAGQAVGLLEFSAYYKVDITNYENIIGMTNYVPLTNVVVAHASTGNNDEVALDIEMAIAMAPSLSRVIVYEGGNNTSPSSLLSRMANDNLARQLSCSWTWTGGPNSTVDTLLKQMAAQGQSFFQASGDDDAYTGANTLDNAAPVDSTNLTCVGGTTLTMNGVGVSWASETVWNYNLNGLPNTGSGGGISPYYTIPWWQTNVSMAANQGSTTFRNVPDVALTADNVFVCYGDGNTNGSIYYMGTSCAAPLWAGFCALVNQQMAASSAVSGITNVGFLNPALYAIGLGTNYSACFHDITTGNNIGTNTPGFFYATNGYDLCTGWGTPTGTNLINALAPYPYIITPPASQTATNGNNVAFSVVAGGQPPFSYRWLFNGTNLPAGGNVSGTTSNVLSITSVTTANVGNYSASVTNSCGSVTSSVATLTVVSPPVFSTQPTNQTVVAGSNAVFSATVSGTLPLVYQWRQNGTNLVNGGNISGATTNALTLTAVTTNNAGNYTLVVTNIYGPATSSIAVLTVVSAPGITIPPTNQTIQCGSNAAFSVTATGTAPLYFQWSLDSAPLAGATNTSLLLTNVHLPNHTVAVVVTNLYGSATSAVTLTVVDTLPPVITLNGANPFYVELGSAYIEAGATAYDLCAGVVPVSISGTVNTNAVSTNTVTYTATDGNGNTNTATRTVIVRDTTPPTILWSFTNLVLAAGTNCATPMPDVTGTNFIRATDLSPPLTITQSPTNNAALPLGTNIVVITVADAYGNTAYSTNQIIVQDQSPPVIWLQPQSQTNTVGASASFSVVATACTPLTFQWFFNNAALAAETNSTLTLSNLNATLAGNYFVVASAAGGSTTSSVATLTVNLLSPTIAGVVANANGSVTLDLTGAVGSVYILETTTNLSTANWLPLTTNTPGTNGAWQFTDLAATNYPQRFYRLMLTP